MRYLSLFSGIEAASVAWLPLGWTCVGVAEIDPFPCAVLAHHYPDVPNLGSVVDITDAQIAALGPVDIVVGGSPCQDLSVAGKRAGLAGERSGLFHQQLRIFHAARHFCGARFLLWENVPGAFSSNRGLDFAVVAGEMAGCRLPVPDDGWGTEGVALGEHGLLEWAVLDAQWFGVAQRRRRVFALLDTGDWTNRSPILLEPDKLRGDSAPIRSARQDAPAGTLRSTDGGGLGTDFDCDGGVISIQGNLIGRDAGGPVGVGVGVGGPMFTLTKADVHGVAHTLRGEGFDASQDGTGRGTPLVPVGVALRGRDGGATAELGDEVAFTLRASEGGGDKPHVLAHAFDARQSDVIQYGDKSGPIDTDGHSIGVLAEHYSHDYCQDRIYSSSGIAPALNGGMQVRRLTPTECERLQGFRDNYTAIPWHKKPASECPDGPRYKALGNSMAVPVMRWIGKRIAMAVPDWMRGGKANDRRRNQEPARPAA